MNNFAVLKSLGVFSQLSEEDLEGIANLLEEKRVGKDEIIFRQGENGDAMYLVRSGRIKCVAVDQVGRERVVGFCSDGQAFGEMDLLTGEPRSVTMQAAQDSRLLVLRKDAFDAFLAENVQAMLQMMRVIADRQAATTVRPTRGDGATAPTGSASGKVFTVFGPKGGSGRSTLAVNLAVALARQHPESVVLVDLALTFGHDLLLLNLAAKPGLASTTADALAKMGPAEGLGYYLSVHEPSGLRVMVGATSPEQGEALLGETAKVAIEQLRKHFAYVVVDTSNTFTDPVLAALEASDRVLLLCTPEMTTLRDARECQRIFNDVIHISKDRILYIMNNVLPYKGLSKSQFEDALQQPVYMDLPNGGDVPLKAALRGEAFVSSQPGSTVARAVQKLASQLVKETAAAAGPDAQRGKWKGLFGG